MVTLSLSLSQRERGRPSPLWYTLWYDRVALDRSTIRIYSFIVRFFHKQQVD